MFTSRHAIQPEEIDLLQRVFDRLCADANIAKCSDGAEFVGASLIELFQAGTHDEATLLAFARARQADLFKRTA